MSNAKMDALAAMRKEATEAAKTGGTKKKRIKAANSAPRQRSAVNLTASAVQALNNIREAIARPGDAMPIGNSAVMCLALELTAERLGANKNLLRERFLEHRELDKRGSA